MSSPKAAHNTLLIASNQQRGCIFEHSAIDQDLVQELCHILHLPLEGNTVHHKHDGSGGKREEHMLGEALQPSSPASIPAWANAFVSTTDLIQLKRRLACAS